MVKFIAGPAGGFPNSRVLGTKVTLAGRTAILPNDNVPFVVQRLTMGQINAIPKDQFAVSLMDPSIPVMAIAGDRKGGGKSLAIRIRQRHQAAGSKGVGSKGVVGFITQDPSKMINVGIDSTKEFTALISLISQAGQQASILRGKYRQLSRTVTETPPTESGIFYAPIDEDELSDCILKIIERYFGTKDSTKIMGTDFKLGEFCVLMHFYFIRIGIMENKSRQPFANYLTKKVFGDEEKFTPRSFNNYAKNYENIEKDLTESKGVKFNFEIRPNPSGKPVHDAFHEIGYNFHHSHFFEELRKLRKRMNEFGF